MNLSWSLQPLTILLVLSISLPVNALIGAAHLGGDSPRLRPYTRPPARPDNAIGLASGLGHYIIRNHKSNSIEVRVDIA